MTMKWRIAYLAPLPLFLAVFLFGMWGVDTQTAKVRSGQVSEASAHAVVAGGFAFAILAVIATVIWVSAVGVAHLIKIGMARRSPPNKALQNIGANRAES